VHTIFNNNIIPIKFYIDNFVGTNKHYLKFIVFSILTFYAHSFINIKYFKQIFDFICICSIYRRLYTNGV